MFDFPGDGPILFKGVVSRFDMVAMEKHKYDLAFRPNFHNFAHMNDNQNNSQLKPVRITAMRQTVYRDLMQEFENPIEHTCDIQLGQSFVSMDAQRPQGLCESAWESMRPFVEALARGEGNFYDGWMKNPYSAMISCNDGFRPVSFYLETVTTKD